MQLFCRLLLAAVSPAHERGQSVCSACKLRVLPNKHCQCGRRRRYHKPLASSSSSLSLAVCPIRCQGLDFMS